MFKLALSSLVLLACVACGSSFDASGSGGASGSHAGAPEAGATAMGGDTSSGANGGESSAGSSSAGESSSGGDSTAGNGGTASGGAADGGSGTSAGSGGDDCTALKTEYAALVKKARVCDQGSLDQCSTASKAPPVGGCGCPTLVNANSQYTALAADKYKAIQKGKCDGGVTCALGCLPPTGASCAQSTGMGSSEFVCTGTSGGIAN